MKNTIYLDSDFNFLLLENEEEDTGLTQTKIYINIPTSAAANQELEISVAGGAPITESIPSSAKVNFELSQQYWADNGDVEITPKNDDITGDTITIHFPESFMVSAALNYLFDDEFEIVAQNEDFAGGGSGSGSGSGGGSAFDFVETIRNIGFRLLDEPSNVNAYFDEIAEEVQIKWTDPADISTNEPAPAIWAGTVVVRKEGSPPKHRWDGTEIEDSTTRDEYSVDALVDDTIELNKSYYYGIFPYDTKGDYRFTKVITVQASETPLEEPQIVSLSVNGSEVTVNYTIPVIEGTYSTLVLVAKKNSAPTSKTDGTAYNISANSTSKLVMYLNKESTYYFKIFAEVGSKSTESNITSGVTGYTTKLVETEIRDNDMYNKVNGARWQTQGSPTITYDSTTQSMRAYIYDTNDMYFSIGRSRTKLESLTTEIEINIPDSLDVKLSFEALSLWIGYLTDDSSNRLMELLGSSSYVLSGNPPLKSQRNAFHKVRTKVAFNSGQPYNVQIFVDDTLYVEQAISYTRANNDLFSVYLYSVQWRTVYVKSMKCNAVFIDE